MNILKKIVGFLLSSKEEEYHQQSVSKELKAQGYMRVNGKLKVIAAKT